MPNIPYEAVLFDMDGVILDSMQQHADAWEVVLAGESLEVERGFILEHEGSLGIDVLVKLMRGRGLDIAEGAARELMKRLLTNQFTLYLERYINQVSPFRDAAALLAALGAAGVPAALVTSSRRPLVEQALGREILAHFAHVVTADDVTCFKPHPEPYQTAARALGKPPERCLVVENAPAGIQAAHSAGASCFALATTLPEERLRRTEAQRVFRDLADLADHLGLGPL